MEMSYILDWSECDHVSNQIFTPPSLSRCVALLPLTIYPNTNCWLCVSIHSESFCNICKFMTLFSYKVKKFIFRHFFKEHFVEISSSHEINNDLFYFIRPSANLKKYEILITYSKGIHTSIIFHFLYYESVPYM